jgi:beta-1,4-N-acetylglucosaminyltransferase
MKISLVCSSGGHLIQILSLKPWWGKYEHFWVTFRKEDAISLLKDEKKYYVFFPTNRNLLNLVRNTFLAIKILRKEKPDLIFSTGAGIALPFFYVAKVFGAKLIYLEVYDRIDSPTLTGRLVYPIVDKFLIQWKEQKKFYPKAELWGQAI